MGGKTGINFRGTKNVVGAFHPARRISVFLGSLSTLPAAELMSGLAEVLKAAFLGERELWDILVGEREAVLRWDTDAMERVVRHSLGLKARIVSEDPTESGVRAHLNLGHTFAHALEAAAGPGAIKHGAAVAWGIARALDLGARMGYTDASWREEAVALLRAYGFRLTLRELAPRLAGRTRRILEGMRQDKKKQAGSLRFVLQRRRGDTFVASDVPRELVAAVLDQEL